MKVVVSCFRAGKEVGASWGDFLPRILKQKYFIVRYHKSAYYIHLMGDVILLVAPSGCSRNVAIIIFNRIHKKKEKEICIESPLCVSIVLDC